MFAPSNPPKGASSTRAFFRAEGEVVLERAPRWVVARLGRPHRTWSWAVVGGGVCTASIVAWHQVDNAELGPDVDAGELLRDRLAAAGLGGAVGMLTSRDVRFVHTSRRQHAGVAATAVVTAGFSNALRVGDVPGPHQRAGTINVLCVVDQPLSSPASLEAMSIVAEARTAAVLDAQVPSIASEQLATGTGTDCIVLASPEPAAPDDEAAYAGKHTPAGSAIGAAVREAVLEASRTWKSQRSAGALRG